MLAGVHEPEFCRDVAFTRMLRCESGLLGKNARAMYYVVLVGSTENTTLLLLVRQLEVAEDT